MLEVVEDITGVPLSIAEDDADGAPSAARDEEVLFSAVSQPRPPPPLVVRGWRVFSSSLPTTIVSNVNAVFNAPSSPFPIRGLEEPTFVEVPINYSI